MTPNSSLLQWLATFKLDGQPSIELKDDMVYYKLADGYVCARILNQISSQHFSNEWLDGIKPVPPDGSWRLRVSNLKRILKKIDDYASALQSPKFRPSAITPDVAVIAQNFDPDQISRLIQLILFCSINCDKKEDYISGIIHLPEQVKQDIKNAIEEILIKNDNSFNQNPNTSHVGNDSVNSESNFDITTNSAHKYNQQIPSQSTPTRSTAFRANMRRDSSQLSSDMSRSHLDTSTQSAHDYPIETIEEMKSRLNAALAIKDEKAQACHELELKMKQLQLEKDQLIFENERLLANEKSSSKLVSSPKRVLESTRQFSRDIDLTGDKDGGGRFTDLERDSSQSLILQQNKKLQIEIQRLKEQLIKVDNEKEECRLKSNLLKEDLDRLTLERDVLRKTAEQAKRLQDELDEFDELSKKVVSYETMVDNLKKKNNDMKKELKSIEEKNLGHIHKIVMLEEENKQLSGKISRIEIYENQIKEAQIKLSKEAHRADEAEVELARLSEKYNAARRENEKLYDDQLRRGASVNPKDVQESSVPTTELRIRDLALETLKGSNSGNAAKYAHKPLYGLDDAENEADNDILNSMSTSVLELKERLARLEYENELLQNKLNAKRENDDTVLSGLLEGAKTRCTKLELENRQSRKKILLLESQIKDLVNNTHNGASTSTATIKDSSSDNTLALINRVEELQRLLFQKEQELMDSETKYKRNLQKAKDVIKTLNSNQSIISGSLHPSCMSSASPFNSSSLDETNLLKQQLKDREERLIEMEREFYEFKKFKEIHERLIISAFYGLTTPMQWRNAEKRLERTTLTSPPNTASSSMNHHSKHSH